MEIFFVPLPIVDLPLSLVADLLYLPSDLAYWPEWVEARKRKNMSDQERSEDSPPRRLFKDIEEEVIRSLELTLRCIRMMSMGTSRALLTLMAPR